MFYNDTFIAPESEQGRKPEPRKNLYLNFIDVSETFRLFILFFSRDVDTTTFLARFGKRRISTASNSMKMSTKKTLFEFTCIEFDATETRRLKRAAAVLFLPRTVAV